MTTNEGAAPSTGTAPSKTRAAARLARIDAQRSAGGDPRPVTETPVTETPTAEVVEIRPTRETRSLRVACPFGAHQHLHGYGWSPDEPVEPRVTYRVAHCGCGEYRIVVPAWAAELVRPGSKRRDGAE